MNPSAKYEFTAQQVARLLAELDQRLARRGVRAAVFVVGGAAIAANHLRDGRLTADVDAVSTDDAILAEAGALARARGIPANWLNFSARPWMPPLPPGVLAHPDRPGLRVTCADDSFLLATKLVAQRSKDAEDIVERARRLNMQQAGADELEAHIRRYYSEPEALRFIMGTNSVDKEVRYLAEDAARMLAKASNLT